MPHCRCLSLKCPGIRLKSPTQLAGFLWIEPDEVFTPRGGHMVESEAFAEATVEKLAEADVIMAIGQGDRQAPKVLVGREKFVSAASNQAIAAETRILRVEITSEEEFGELKEKVKEAKGELDPGVE